MSEEVTGVYRVLPRDLMLLREARREIQVRELIGLTDAESIEFDSSLQERTVLVDSLHLDPYKLRIRDEDFEAYIETGKSDAKGTAENQRLLLVAALLLEEVVRLKDSDLLHEEAASKGCSQATREWGRGTKNSSFAPPIAPPRLFIQRLLDIVQEVGHQVGLFDMNFKAVVPHPNGIGLGDRSLQKTIGHIEEERARIASLTARRAGS